MTVVVDGDRFITSLVHFIVPGEAGYFRAQIALEMFFIIERKDTLDLHPRYFGREVDRMIEEQLKQKVEGTCSARYGYTIMVIRIKNVDDGRLNEVLSGRIFVFTKSVLYQDSGFAQFPVSYLTLVFRPFKNEIMNAKVTKVIEVHALYVREGK